MCGSGTPEVTGVMTDRSDRMAACGSFNTKQYREKRWANYIIQRITGLAFVASFAYLDLG